MGAKKLEPPQLYNCRVFSEADQITLHIEVINYSSLSKETRSEQRLAINLKEVNKLLKKKHVDLPTEIIVAIIKEYCKVVAALLLKGNQDAFIQLLINNRGFGAGRILKII